VSLVAAIRARLIPAVPDPQAAAVARFVAEAGGGAVRSVVFFGSRKTRAQPDVFSAFDLFVVTDGYRAFYRSLRGAGLLRRHPTLGTALNAILPPNQVSIPVPGAEGPRRAKCAVVSADHLRRETSPARHDHFFLGRLFQWAELAWSADPEATEEILACVVNAHVLTYRWARPWLPTRFDAGEYARALLRISYSAEIRPEPEGRAQAIWDAQQGYLRDVYVVLLRELAERGELREDPPGHFAVVRPAGRWERVRLAAYLRWSLVRATLRWAKYMITFDDWLEFILRKARRHSGEDIVLTSRERKAPLIFLWPRFLRYLRHKDR